MDRNLPQSTVLLSLTIVPVGSSADHLDYVKPYSAYVPQEPTWEQMKDVVCVRGIRPELPYNVTIDKVQSGGR